MEVHTAPESTEVRYVKKIHWLPVVVPEVLGVNEVRLAPNDQHLNFSHPWFQGCTVEVSAVEVMGFPGLKLTLPFHYAEKEISRDVFLWREGARIIGANEPATLTGPDTLIGIEKKFLATDVPVGEERLWVYLGPCADVQCVRTEPTFP